VAPPARPAFRAARVVHRRFTVFVAIVGWFLAATFVDDGVGLLAPIALLSYFAFFVLASLSWVSRSPRCGPRAECCWP